MKPLRIFQAEDTPGFFDLLPKPSLTCGSQSGLPPWTELAWKPPEGKVHIRYPLLLQSGVAYRINT